jgi:hypothetical protein
MPLALIPGPNTGPFLRLVSESVQKRIERLKKEAPYSPDT